MLGLGANITGGAPVGASGVSAPNPPPDYLYESDFTSDVFIYNNVSSQLVDHEGRTDVIRIYNSTLSTFTAYNASVYLPSGIYGIDFWYYIPSGSDLQSIRIFKNEGTDVLVGSNEIQYDQWTQVITEFTINNDVFFYPVFTTFSSSSPNDLVFLSDIKIFA